MDLTNSVLKDIDLDKLRSTHSADIKFELIKILDDITDTAVKALDQEFRALLTLAEKHALLSEFEAPQFRSPVKTQAGEPQTTQTTTQEKPKRDSILLKNWTHYCWMRLELTAIADQRAALNFIQQAKNQIESVDDPFAIPALAGSIDRAIQEDAKRGISIKQSIQTLSKLMLQVVGTEHPTDPLSQQARQYLTNLANVIEKITINLRASEQTNEADEVNNIKLKNKKLESEILSYLKKLKKVDTIPPAKRDVVEEINRNIDMTLEKFNNVLAQLADTVLKAYQTYYPKQFSTYTDKIWAALLEVFRPASWPGYDADGNINVTPDTMREATRLQRIRVTEQHIKKINAIVHIAKTEVAIIVEDIKNKLLEELYQLNEEFFNGFSTAAANQQGLINSSIIIKINSHQNNILRYLNEKRFDKAIAENNQLNNFSLSQLDDQSKSLCTLLDKRNTLIKSMQYFDTSPILTDNSKYQEYQALLTSLEDLKKTLDESYKPNIRSSTGLFQISDETTEFYPTDYLLNLYKQISTEHQALFEQSSPIGKTWKYLGLQFKTFGMTYGEAHVRQDSSVFIDVWDTILEDLKQQSSFNSFFIFKLLENTSYKKITPDDRAKLHIQLQDGSIESNQILEKIYHNWHAQIYLNDPKYKNKNEFETVRTEIERCSVVTEQPDMFTKFIISNAENSADILGATSLFKIFPKQNKNLRMVPLLEKRQDLENYETILTTYIQVKIQQLFEQLFDQGNLLIVGFFQTKENIKNTIFSLDRTAFKEWINRHPLLQALLEDLMHEVMIGFSDTERVSGIPALFSIQETQEKIVTLAADFGVGLQFYYGPGDDVNRGGLREIDGIMTLQGLSRRMVSTPQSAFRFYESQFHNAYEIMANPEKLMELTQQPPEIANLIEEFKIKGTRHYEFLHDMENGLGKLLGLMLGSGVHWLVDMLNSSSRASQRKSNDKDNHGDRTAAVQTGGITPAKFIHPDKPRAISATQMKEMLDEYINITFGAGAALREMGIDNIEIMYDNAKTMRDIVLKTLYGISKTKYSTAAYAYFGDNIENVLPKDPAEREQLILDCLTKYPAILKEINVEKILKEGPEEKQNQLKQMLLGLFCYLNDEYEQTKEFLFKLNKLIHGDVYHPLPTEIISSEKMPPTEITAGTDLLFHYPTWQAQAEDISREVELLSLLLAHEAYHVGNKRNLNTVYPELGVIKTLPGSHLSGIGGLLADKAGITTARISPPGYYEKAILNDKTNSELRPGVVRAQQEALAQNRVVHYGKKGGDKATLFANTIGEGGKKILETQLVSGRNKKII